MVCVGVAWTNQSCEYCVHIGSGLCWGVASDGKNLKHHLLNSTVVWELAQVDGTEVPSG